MPICIVTSCSETHFLFPSSQAWLPQLARSLTKPTAVPRAAVTQQLETCWSDEKKTWRPRPRVAWDEKSPTASSVTCRWERGTFGDAFRWRGVTPFCPAAGWEEVLRVRLQEAVRPRLQHHQPPDRERHHHLQTSPQKVLVAVGERFGHSVFHLLTTFIWVYFFQTQMYLLTWIIKSLTCVGEQF